MAYNPQNPNGQGTMATSTPVVIASNQSAIPMAQIDTAITGSLSATDILAGVPAGTGVFIAIAPTAGSFVASLVPGGSAQADIQITGTATGTYYFEASLDSTTGSDGNWIAVNYRQTGIINTVLGFSSVAVGLYRGAPSAFKYIRVRNVGGTTPTNPIIFRYSNGSGTTFLNASIPGGTNTIGTVNIAAAQTIAAVTAITNALPVGGNKIGTVDIATAPATAKNVQGANFLPTQDAHNTGRNQVHYFTLIPVLSTAVDTLQSLTGTKGGVTVVATTTPAVVTAAKRMRITRMATTYIATATSGYGLVRLRFNTAAIVDITSPIAATIAVGSGAPTTANSADTEEAILDEGWEFAAGTGIGISVQGFAAVTATAVGYVLVSITGYEY